ncbi:MAG: tRNA (adenosine(37)-N6)-threonylcarbamoyltransferase complex dimerization subunit type 1 TsaB [Vicinamibacterales bacterium]
MVRACWPRSSGDATRTHAERLPREILDTLSAAGLTTGDVDLFAVASGPGSFTGLRIGIATVQGLAFVHHKPVAPVSVLRALAEVAAMELPAGTRIGAWMDAHRREVFSALYEIVTPGDDTHTSHLREIEGAHVSTAADTVARWARVGPPVAIRGDGATLFSAVAPAGTRVIAAPSLAPVIGRLAPGTPAVSPAGIQPLYVRRPDAEIARDAALPKR